METILTTSTSLFLGSAKSKVNTFITEASTILKFRLKHHFTLEKNFSGFRMCGFGVYGISMRGVGMCGTGGYGVWLWDRGVTVQHVRAWSVWSYDVRVWVLFTRMCKFWVRGVWVPLLNLRSIWTSLACGSWKKMILNGLFWVWPTFDLEMTLEKISQYDFERKISRYFRIRCQN